MEEDVETQSVWPELRKPQVCDTVDEVQTDFLFESIFDIRWTVLPVLDVPEFNQLTEIAWTVGVVI